MINNYPPVLSGEQVRRILRISKRKCALLLNNGVIKCQKDLSKKSRKYSVNREDLLEYIDKAKYINKINILYHQKAELYHSVPEGFSHWLELKFKNIPDVLTIPQVIDITGYRDNSVERWINRKWLKSTGVPTGRIVAKQWLIEFYCGYGYSIVRKSDKHISLMYEFFANLSSENKP